MQHKRTTKNEFRESRHARIRARVSGTAERPRLAVFRSNRFISAQLIDDTAGTTLAAAHGRDVLGTQPRRPATRESGSRPRGASGSVQAMAVGTAIAKKAKTAGVAAIVFDRGGYRYAGQVKTLAEAARAGGLTF